MDRIVLILANTSDANFSLTDLENGELFIDETNNDIGFKKIDGTVVPSMIKSANVLSASKLSLKRKIELTGDIAGNILFDGSEDVLIDTSLKVIDVNLANTFNSATQINRLTFDEFGRLVSVSNPITLTPEWVSILNKPTNLAGYGITDASPLVHDHNLEYEPKNSNIQAHITSQTNPHGVTASQLGVYTKVEVNSLLSQIESGTTNETFMDEFKRTSNNANQVLFLFDLLERLSSKEIYILGELRFTVVYSYSGNGVLSSKRLIRFDNTYVDIAYNYSENGNIFSIIR